MPRFRPLERCRLELVLHVEADAPELNVICHHFVLNPLTTRSNRGVVTAKLIPFSLILEFTEIRPPELEPEAHRLTDLIIHAGDQLIFE